MKRYICLLLVSTLSLMLISGCAETAEWELTEYDDVNNIDKVSMTIKDGTVSSAGLTIILKNDSDIEYGYGQYYLLEKKIKGKWYKVPVTRNDAFEDIAYLLVPGENIEWDIKWVGIYGNLDNGEYRIIKEVFNYTEENSIEYILAAEFKI